jgi:hypothetical protein
VRSGTVPHAIMRCSARPVASSSSDRRMILMSIQATNRFRRVRLSYGKPQAARTDANTSSGARPKKT